MLRAIRTCSVYAYVYACVLYIYIYIYIYFLYAHVFVYVCLYARMMYAWWLCLDPKNTCCKPLVRLQCFSIRTCTYTYRWNVHFFWLKTVQGPAHAMDRGHTTHTYTVSQARLTWQDPGWCPCIC
jgi:hypothetical protein